MGENNVWGADFMQEINVYFGFNGEWSCLGGIGRLACPPVVVQIHRDRLVQFPCTSYHRIRKFRHTVHLNFDVLVGAIESSLLSHHCPIHTRICYVVMLLCSMNCEVSLVLRKSKSWCPQAQATRTLYTILHSNLFFCKLCQSSCVFCTCGCQSSISPPILILPSKLYSNWPCRVK